MKTTKNYIKLLKKKLEREGIKMENNTNHTIATLFNELSSGRSIDLDYNNRS